MATMKMKKANNDRGVWDREIIFRKTPLRCAVASRASKFASRAKKEAKGMSSQSTVSKSVHSRLTNGHLRCV